MKLPENTNVITGNLEFDEEHEMGVHDAAKSIVLNSLIGLYSDPYLAALREYTSNALDSHREAGQTAPVEVYLPNRLTPNFIVQDFGVGMSRTDLYNYGQFGFSSKRDDNTGIGGFGLGSKVGLAVAASYTVSAVKDGKKNVAVIGRNDQGAPKFGLMAEVDTDEPNGVKVSIPSSESYAFERAVAGNFFLGWEPGTITINGEQPKVSVFDTEMYIPLEEFGFKRTNLIGNNRNYDESVALIDAVRYTINWNKVPGVDSKLMTGFLRDTVIRLDNGSVKLVPSREDLEYNRLTRDAILSRVTELVNIGKVEFVNDVAKAGSRLDALRLAKKARDYGFSEKFTWKGEDVEVTVPNDIRQSLMTYVGFGRNYEQKLYKDRNSYSLSQFASSLHNSLFVNSYQNEEPHIILVHSCGDPVQLKPRNAYTEETIHAETKNSTLWAENYATVKNRSISSFKVLFMTESVDKLSEWVTEPFARIMSADDFLEELTEIRRARTKARRDAAGPRPKLEDSSVRLLRVSNEGASTDHKKPLSSLDNTKTYVLLQNGVSDFDDRARKILTARTSYYDHKNLGLIIQEALRASDAQVLVANKGVKTSHYAASLPNMISLKDLIEKTAKDSLAKLTDIELEARVARSNTLIQWARSVSVPLTDIEDDETRAWLTATSGPSVKLSNLLVLLKDRPTTYGITFDSTRIDAALEVQPLGLRYPLLLGRHGAVGPDEAEYINMLDHKRKAAELAAAQESKVLLAESSAA